MRRVYKTDWFNKRIRVGLSLILNGGSVKPLFKFFDSYRQIANFLESLENSGYIKNIYYGDRCIDFKTELTEKGLKFIGK